MAKRCEVSTLALLFLFLFLSSCSLLRIELTEREILTSFGQPQQHQLEKEFSILVWNVYKEQKENWQTEYRKLKGNYDIHIFQEAMCCQTKPERGYQQVFAKSFIYTNTGVATGVSTSSRVGAVFSQYLRSIGREPIVATPKMALITKYSLPYGEKLLVANIHSLNFVSNKEWAMQLTGLLSKLSQHKGPLLIAGDFNTWNEERVATMLKSTNKLRLNSVSFNNSDTRLRILGYPLDHIFYRGLTVKNANVIKSNGSDHQPMSVQFKVKAPGPRYAGTNGKKCQM
ncbi:MAG: endonuclease/exonuclease/phosphatase family protein [Bacteriovoracaceae bacterium]|jgi:endonuclease/exonuclease/phosphatase (EEP) superfamily protein YafD|nr:endonuclease/exonuclease/phosphatase family protein [Bacteriovoracaceae bacterium]